MLSEHDVSAAYGYALRHCSRELSKTQRLIFGEIVVYSFLHDRGIAWPSYQTIMAAAGCSETSVREAIKALVKSGDLDYRSHGGPSRGQGEKTNAYYPAEKFQRLWIEQLKNIEADLRNPKTVDQVEKELTERNTAKFAVEELRGEVSSPQENVLKNSSIDAYTAKNAVFDSEDDSEHEEPVEAKPFVGKASPIKDRLDRLRREQIARELAALGS